MLLEVAAVVVRRHLVERQPAVQRLALVSDQAFEADVDRTWRSDWKYLATGGTQHVEDLKADVKGLALPRSVIDKLYYRNAQRIFLHRA